MNAISTLVQSYLTDHSASAKEIVDALPSDQLESLVNAVDPESLIALYEIVTPSRSVELFQHLSDKDKLATLVGATPRTAVILLSGLDDETRNSLLSGLPATSQRELTRILNFPDNTAARLMDRATDTLRPNMNVGDAKNRLRSAHVRRARSLYVINDEGSLIGRVDVQDLAISDDSKALEGLIRNVDCIAQMQTTREELVALFTQWGLDSIPVVDADQRLIGVVRYAGIISAAQSVASADLQKMVGVSAEERALSPATFAVKRRLPWLHINLLTAFLAAAVVGLFEDLISQFTALAILLPVVAGQSGNAGAQALAVTMRGLSLREVGLRHWRRVLGKETMVGLMDGLVLALTCGAGVLVWSSSLGLAAVIGVAMILSMIAAGMAGAAVPMMLTRLGQDPATASSIILTTVTDVAGFFSFLGTATLLQFLL